MDDQTLVRAVAEGDAAAFDVLYERYRERVYGFLVRLTQSRATADDLLQETFLKLCRRPPVLQGGSLGPWLFTVARNQAISHLRWRASDAYHLGRLVFESGGAELRTPYHAVSAAADHRRLEAALAALSVADREVLLLVGAEALSNADAAVVLGIREDALRQRLSRARTRLSALLDKSETTRRSSP